MALQHHHHGNVVSRWMQQWSCFRHTVTINCHHAPDSVAVPWVSSSRVWQGV